MNFTVLLLLMITTLSVHGGRKRVPITEELRRSKAAEMKQAVLNRIEEMATRNDDEKNSRSEQDIEEKIVRPFIRYSVDELMRIGNYEPKDWNMNSV